MPLRTTGWSSTIDDADHDRTQLVARRGEDRQPGVDPPAVDRRPGIEAATEGAGPLAHPDQPEVAGCSDPARRRPAVVGDGEPHRRRDRRRRCTSTELPAAWRATLASASRVIRCTAMPVGPASSATPGEIVAVMSSPGTAVLVDESLEIGRTDERRIGAPLVGAQRGHRGADLIEAGPPDALGVGERPLGVVEVAPQDVAGAGDVEEHRRQRVAGEVVQFAGDAPPLLGDGLLGERLAGLFAARRSGPAGGRAADRWRT